jgi:hypothetical protein
MEPETLGLPIVPHGLVSEADAAHAGDPLTASVASNHEGSDAEESEAGEFDIGDDDFGDVAPEVEINEYSEEKQDGYRVLRVKEGRRQK